MAGKKIDLRGLKNMRDTLYMFEQDVMPRHIEEAERSLEIYDMTQLDAAAHAIEEARLAIEKYVEYAEKVTKP
jgi:hypothetical protein